MEINYQLQLLRIREDTRDYCPGVILAGRVNYPKLTTSMAQANTSFSHADIVGVLDLAMKTIMDFVTQGYSVTLPLFTVRPVGKGRIRPDSTDIWVEARLQPGKMLRKAMSVLSLRRKPQGGIADRPEPFFLLDNKSHTWNVFVTLGGTATLIGERLKFDGKDPRQGVFFIEQESGVELRAKCSGKVRAGRLELTLPAGLEVGKTYAVEIRTVFAKDTGRRLRVEQLQHSVTVKAA